MRPLSLVLLATALTVPLSVPAQPAGSAAPGAVSSQEEPKIEGLEVARPKGGFLGVTLEGVRLRVTFYDKDKKRATADAVRIAARWDHPRETGGIKSTVLTPAGPDSLISPTLIRPPHTYNVTLVLVGADDAVLEQHIINLGAVSAAGSEKKKPEAGSQG